jgi:hypothetical protein
VEEISPHIKLDYRLLSILWLSEDLTAQNCTIARAKHLSYVNFSKRPPAGTSAVRPSNFRIISMDLTLKKLLYFVSVISCSSATDIFEIPGERKADGRHA